jgi:hypothetical protein
MIFALFEMTSTQEEAKDFDVNGIFLISSYVVRSWKMFCNVD